MASDANIKARNKSTTKKARQDNNSSATTNAISILFSILI